MARAPDTLPCPLCGVPTPASELALVGWQPPSVLARLASDQPGWGRVDGACPACVQQSVLQLLLERGDLALHELVQATWPLDAESAFGALPTALRMHADPRYTGGGVTIAQVDAAFFPHPDLTQPVNRIRAWVDAGREQAQVRYFTPTDHPRWPRWRARDGLQWHGLMTTAALAGNGRLSRGLYRGLASGAELVLVQARDEQGRISNLAIARALRWLVLHGPGLGVRIVSLSVGGDPIMPLRGNAVDMAVADLSAAGIVVVAAAGNAGQRRLVPPATAPEAITVGGLDDKNSFDPADVALWHSNYGQSTLGAPKPEVVAPSLWVVAPIMPESAVATEAVALFARRAAGDVTAEAGITELKLVTPYYQHVEGTSFAAPIVASVVACMLEANPTLTPATVRHLLTASAQPVAAAPPERQGAGAVDAGQAVQRALRAHGGPLVGQPQAPSMRPDGAHFLLYDPTVGTVRLFGSWDSWRWPGAAMQEAAPGLWTAVIPRLAPGRYLYKFLLDDRRWLDDPSNAHKVPDGVGGLNTVLSVPVPIARTNSVRTAVKEPV